MHRNLGRALATVGLALAIGATPLLSATAAPMPVGPAPRAMPMTEYRWDWSDGSNATFRTFAQSDYGTQANLPHLIVTQYPVRPTHKVYLQFFQDGAWHNDTMVYTNGSGRATLDFDPYCSNGTWCDGTYTYRITVAHQVKRFKVRFTSN